MASCFGNRMSSWRGGAPRGVSRGAVVIGLVVLTAILAGAAIFSRGRGYKSWVAHRFFGAPAPFAHRPTVTATRPGAFESAFPLDGFVAADVDFPNPGSAIDPATVTPKSVRLFRQPDRQEVAVAVNTSGAGDAIVLRPRDPASEQGPAAHHRHLLRSLGHGRAPGPVGQSRDAGALGGRRLVRKNLAPVGSEPRTVSGLRHRPAARRARPPQQSARLRPRRRPLLLPGQRHRHGRPRLDVR